MPLFSGKSDFLQDGARGALPLRCVMRYYYYCTLLDHDHYLCLYDSCLRLYVIMRSFVTVMIGTAPPAKARSK